jgi:simple sugar transport system ATP-binding protein
MYYYDTDITKYNTHQRRKIGFSFIPEDRHLQGLLMDLDICNNFYLNNLVNEYSNFKFIRWKKLYEDVGTVIENYNIMPNNSQNIVSKLSGGNQQKVVLSRETYRIPDFLVVSNPTWGLDVEAAEFVHDRLVELNKQGTSIMLFSSDLNELLKLSTRLLIFYRGKITYDESIEKAELSDISNAMAGI